MSEKRESDAMGELKSSEKDNHIESFQDHLDVFIEQEDSLLFEHPNTETDEMQDHLDHFIEDVDHQFEAQQEVDFDEAVSHLDPFEEDAGKIFHPESTVDHDEGAAYGKLIMRALAGTILIIIVVVWFVWPSGPMIPPQPTVEIEVAETADQPDEAVQINHGSPLPEPEAEAVALNPPEHLPTTLPAAEVETIRSEEPDRATSDEILPEAADRTMKVSVNRANVRMSPESGARVIAKLTFGTPLLAVDEQGDWFEVRLSQKNGWIHNSVVTEVKEAEKIAPEETRSLVVTVDVGNFRRDPHPKSQIIYKLERGSEVLAIGSEGEWYHIRMRNGVQVWAHQSIF